MPSNKVLIIDRGHVHGQYEAKPLTADRVLEGKRKKKKERKKYNSQTQSYRIEERACEIADIRRVHDDPVLCAGKCFERKDRK